MSSLIVVSKVKQLALKLAAERLTINGQPKFTRVSPKFVSRMENILYREIETAIRNHPTKGKTIE